MSQILDKLKSDIHQGLTRAYKDLRNQMSPEDWSEFEVFFWKVRPLLEVYNPVPVVSETTGPNRPKKEEFVPVPLPDEEFKEGEL